MRTLPSDNASNSRLACAVVTASPAAVDLDLGTETFRVRLSASEGPDALSLELQAAMGDAEQRIADAVRNKDPQALIVVDGPLRGKEHLGVVGMVKSHHTRYLTDRCRQFPAGQSSTGLHDSALCAK